MASSHPLKCFIGFDARQIVSFTVCALSVMQRATKPVAIVPLILETLPMTRRGLTPFTYSRWLVPYLCDYEGTAIFLDADIMLRDDINKLAKCNDGKSAVMMVPHKGALEFERPSVILFNNALCSALTPQYVDDPMVPLFDLAWTEKVGNLPMEWNHLVGYQQPNPDAKLVHFTQGVPVFPETAKSEFADEYTSIMCKAMHAQPWAKIMGTSVHAQAVMERLRKDAA